MPSFRKKPKVKKPPEAEKPKDQAQDLVAAKTALRTPRHNSREDGWIHSVNTRDAYSAVINRACQWMQARGHADGCRSMTVEQAHTYLKYRAARLCQKSLNGERVALEKALPQFDGIRLDRFEAAKGPTRLSTGPRAYTLDQLRRVIARQTAHYALATRIVAATGIRRSEIYTLRPAHEQKPSKHRKWSRHTFQGLPPGELWTVKGKGGLIYPTWMPQHLADELHGRRLQVPREVTDDNIKLKCYYRDLPGGKSWAQSFTRACQREFGWSNGAHGIRHTVAQLRMDYYQEIGMDYNEAREIVSQELGHFRGSITETYLR